MTSLAILPVLMASTLGAGPEWLGAPPSHRPVKRVVCLAPAWTELLFALGAGDVVVGVTRFDDWPEQVKALPKVGGFVDADVEAVLAQRPELVIAAPIPGTRARLETLARMGVPTLLLPAETLDDLWVALQQLAPLVGKAREGEALANRLRAELQSVFAESERQAPVRALLLVGYRPLIAAGPSSFYDALLARMNARNVIERGPPFAHLDLEAIASAAPDVIIDLAMHEVAPDGLWEQLTLDTKRKPRIAHVRETSLLRPGPRLGEGLRLLKSALRPAP